MATHKTTAPSLFNQAGKQPAVPLGILATLEQSKQYQPKGIPVKYEVQWVKWLGVLVFMSVASFMLYHTLVVPKVPEVYFAIADSQPLKDKSTQANTASAGSLPQASLPAQNVATIIDAPEDVTGSHQALNGAQAKPENGTAIGSHTTHDVADAFAALSSDRSHTATAQPKDAQNTPQAPAKTHVAQSPGQAEQAVTGKVKSHAVKSADASSKAMPKQKVNEGDVAVISALLANNKVPKTQPSHTNNASSAQAVATARQESPAVVTERSPAISLPQGAIAMTSSSIANVGVGQTTALNQQLPQLGAMQSGSMAKPELSKLGALPSGLGALPSGAVLSKPELPQLSAMQSNVVSRPELPKLPSLQGATIAKPELPKMPIKSAPTKVVPQGAMDISSMSLGNFDQGAYLVQQCAELGFFAKTLCEWEACSEFRGKSPACPASGASNPLTVNQLQ